MIFLNRAVPALCVLAVLAACGGGGGGGDNPAAEYQSDASRADRLVVETTGLSQTAASAMPAAGRADYDGVVGMAFGAAPASLGAAEMLGELDLTANFATGQITGELDDFNTTGGQELHGNLRVTNGQIAGAGFTADIAGTLTGTATAPGAVAGTVAGDFLGVNAGAIAGTGAANSDAGALGLVFVGTLDRD